MLSEGIMVAYWPILFKVGFSFNSYICREHRFCKIVEYFWLYSCNALCTTQQISEREPISLWNASLIDDRTVVSVGVFSPWMKQTSAIVSDAFHEILSSPLQARCFSKMVIFSKCLEIKLSAFIWIPRSESAVYPALILSLYHLQ